MNDLVLFSHLTGATIMFGLVGASIAALLRSKDQWYPVLAYALGGLLLLQVITGSALALTSAESTSLVSYCSKIGLYLSMTILIEALLLRSLGVKMLSKDCISIASLIVLSIATTGAIGYLLI